MDQLLADETVDDGGTEGVLWALTDWQGSVRHLAAYDESTSTISIENHKFYDAFGNVASETNSAVDTVFGYTDRMWDDDLDLQNNLNRWYDSGVGRWLTEDPADFLAGDPNLYRYVGNSPGMGVDPRGLAPPTWLENRRFEKPPAALPDSLNPVSRIVEHGAYQGERIGRGVSVVLIDDPILDYERRKANKRELVERILNNEWTTSSELTGTQAHIIGSGLREEMQNSYDYCDGLTASGELTVEVVSIVQGGCALRAAVAPGVPISQAAIRQRVLVNIAESQRARVSSKFSAYIAREGQVLSGYSADTWSMTTLKPGSIVYGGVPGQSAFYTDFATVRASELNAQPLFESLQVPPHHVYGYRPGIEAYRVTTELSVPGGNALNNPTFGGGGGQQFFIPNYVEALTPIRQFPLKK